MHPAGDDEPGRRHMHGEEDLAFGRLLDATLPGAQMRFQHVSEGIGRDLVLPHQPLRAALLMGDYDGRAPRAALGVQGFEDVEAHDSISARPRESGDPEPKRKEELDSRLRGNERSVRHQSTFSTNTRIGPPHDSPTFQAVSSATPNSSVFGLPLSITSSASVTTAPSTQPPDTEPRKFP